MTLISILAQFSLVQNRIDALLQSNNANAADLTFLMRQSEDLRSKIVEETPESQSEASEKLACLVNLIRRELKLQGIDGDISHLAQSASEVCDQFMTETFAPSAPPGRPARANSLGGAVFGGSIADYVAFAEGRVSLIGTDYTYIATSAENAEFYGRSQVGLMDAHLTEFIGDFRFETRAKLRLDACFSGDPQTYHHALNCAGEAKIMRCDMKPVNSSDGLLLGALVYMSDVTEQVRKLRPSSDSMAHQFTRRG